MTYSNRVLANIERRDQLGVELQRLVVVAEGGGEVLALMVHPAAVVLNVRLHHYFDAGAVEVEPDSGLLPAGFSPG